MEIYDCVKDILDQEGHEDCEDCICKIATCSGASHYLNISLLLVSVFYFLHK